jgi:hypothetical protein
VTFVNYSDATPDLTYDYGQWTQATPQLKVTNGTAAPAITYNYNKLGNLSSVVPGAGPAAFTYAYWS